MALNIPFLIGSAGREYLEPYGGDYFSFVLIGIAFFILKHSRLKDHA